MLRRLFPERGTRLMEAERARSRAEQMHHNLLVEFMVLKEAKTWTEVSLDRANQRISELEAQLEGATQ